MSAAWLLSQPEGLVTPAGGSAVALRQLTSLGGSVTETPVVKANGQYRIVDVGDEADVDLSKVRGAVAVVAGHCDNLSAVAEKLRAAKAAAMVAYAAAGEQCAGTVDGPVKGLPTLQVRAQDRAALLAGGSAKARLLTHKNPSYMYDLTRFFHDTVPAGATIDGTKSAVATIVETYDGLNSSSADGLKVREEVFGWDTVRGWAAYGLTRRVAFPSTVTHYVNMGAEWERGAVVEDAQYFGEYARIWGGRQTYAAGSTTYDTWFGGPVGLRVSPMLVPGTVYLPPTRELCNDPDVCATPQDVMNFDLGAVTDAAGHIGQTDIFANEYSGSIYADGELILEEEYGSQFLRNVVPDGKHRFRVVTETKRQNPFWQLSTDIQTTWGFTSDTPPADDLVQVLPVLSVDYTMNLSSTNTAPAGRFDFGVRISMPNGITTLPVTKRSVEISWDGGHTWKTAKLAGCSTTTCNVQVTNKSGGSATLRVKATDSAGNTVAQKIVDAYAVD